MNFIDPILTWPESQSNEPHSRITVLSGACFQVWVICLLKKRKQLLHKIDEPAPSFEGHMQFIHTIANIQSQSVGGFCQTPFHSLLWKEVKATITYHGSIYNKLVSVSAHTYLSVAMTNTQGYTHCSLCWSFYCSCRRRCSCLPRLDWVIRVVCPLSDSFLSDSVWGTDWLLCVLRSSSSSESDLE